MILIMGLLITKVTPADEYYELTCVITAYSYSCGSVTATGTYPHIGTIAVDPDVIPMGSKVYIPDYGYCRAEDTGGDIIGNRIDIFVPTDEEAYLWGVREKKVRIYYNE